MQLARLWRQHKEAGCPAELIGVEIAGTEARALDEEITSCVCALLSHTLTVDERIERRLVEVRADLTQRQLQAQPPVAEYCARLNELVSAVLTRDKIGNS
ncbi:MAG TPA: hypothetical protein VMC02_05660 [Steroidobacteraceae bacterium]|nr:hypothetical protein [Steroidobacteraceae bacterium]